MDLFDASVERIERRLAQLVPPPLRHIPVLIGGAGERRTLPAVARHADIWHTFPFEIEEYRRRSKLVAELAAAAGREDTAIERSVAWAGSRSADAFLDVGATLFTTEIHPTDDGYDFTELEQMISWRDGVR
jgi:alkanesulfonate monooxygenase SsuD/methylene tetrahydromethanopterin reductase-like flavin-dependent oxidoreductase (luciferase family)